MVEQKRGFLIAGGKGRANYFMINEQGEVEDMN